MKRTYSVAVILALAGSTYWIGHVNGAAVAAAPLGTDLFVMMYAPGPGWDPALATNAQRHFDVHSANLARLRRDSVIVMGGRFGEWGLILVEAQDEAAARDLFAPDSSLASGTFEGQIHRWTTIFEGAVRRRSAPGG